MDQIKTGALISRLRKQHGLTQRQLAEQLHVSITAVCKWEKGVNTPDISNLEALSNLFNISVSELIKGEEFQPAITTVEENLINNQSPQEEITSLKGPPYKCFILIIIIFLTMVIGGMGIRYYNNRPPSFTIVDSFYSEPEISHKKDYGFEKVYCVIVEYDGKINEDIIFEYNMTLAYEISLKQDLDAANAMYIKYYDNYSENADYNHFSVVFLPLPPSIN